MRATSADVSSCKWKLKNPRSLDAKEAGLELKAAGTLSARSSEASVDSACVSLAGGLPRDDLLVDQSIFQLIEGSRLVHPQKRPVGYYARHASFLPRKPGSGPHPTKTNGNNRTRNGFMDGLNLFG